MTESEKNRTYGSCISWNTEVIGQFQVFRNDPTMLQSIVWFCGGIGLVVVCLNLIVLYSILRARDLRHNSVYIFMFSLAVADLLTAFVFVSIFLKFHVVWTDFEDQNATAANTQELMVSNDRKLNEYLIKLTLVTACFTASIGSLALTAVDRFVAVLKPFEHKVIATKKRCILSVIVMWATSIAVSCLPVAGWKCRFGCLGFPKSGCSQIYPGISQSYLTFYVAFVSSMLLLVVLMYLYIFIIVWRHLERNYGFEDYVVNDNATRRSVRLPRKSSINSLYDLQIADKLPATAASQIQERRQYYELRRDNFRFVLVVDENQTSARNDLSERDLQTCFRGYIFYGGERNRKRKKNAFTNISPAIARKRTNRRLNQARSRNQMQIVQTLILILGVLLICWIPSLTFMIADLLCEMSPGMKKAFAFLALLTLLNSAINPIIYAIRLKELRTTLKNACCRRCSGEN